MKSEWKKHFSIWKSTIHIWLSLCVRTHPSGKYELELSYTVSLEGKLVKTNWVRY